MLFWLIDCEGDVWPGDEHPTIRSRQGHDVNSVLYAVADLGFGAVLIAPNRPAVAVRFNPSRLGGASTAAIFRLLYELRPTEILVAYGADHAKTETLYGVRAAVGRIEDLVQTSSPIMPPSLKTHRWPLENIRREHTVRVQSLLNAWSSNGELLTPELQDNLRAGGLLSGAVIVKRLRGSERLTIDYWDRERNLLGARWMSRAVGQDVQDQPFRELGKKLADSYRKVADDNSPTLEHSIAVIPQSGSSVTVRRSERLCVPWRDATRNDIILSINLPWQIAHLRW